MCQNTGERIHPARKRIFKKNRRVEEDSNSETEEDTMAIAEQDLDYTKYDNLTRMYSLAQKGKITLTKRSLDI